MPSLPEIAVVEAWIDRAGGRPGTAPDVSGAVADGGGDDVSHRAAGVTS